jgi:acetolactate synthase-1/2/3 large subunit
MNFEANDPQSVADAVAVELALAGVDRVFGLPGGEILRLIEAMRRHSIEFVLCRHEADAGLMAANYGKMRGVPGVVLATLGPGASNLLLPITSSLLDREPLVAISAQVPDAWGTSRTHQRLQLLRAYSAVTKYSGAITASTCRDEVRCALRAAAAEPAGPAYLTLSSDVAGEADSSGIGGQTPSGNESGALSLVSPTEAAAEILRRLELATSPVLALGVATDNKNAHLIRRWVDEWNLPVVVTPKAKGIVDEDSPRFCGVVGGMAMDRQMVSALRQSDLIVGFGLDPVEIDGDWHELFPILWVLESAWATGALPRSDVVTVNHGDLIPHLIAAGAPKSWDDPMIEVRALRHRVFYEQADRRSDALSPVEVVRALAAIFPPDTIVATDVGSHKYLFGQFWPSHVPGAFLMSNGLSGMGYGLPAAIGAKLAHPDRVVLAAVGDGGFSMNSQELETARRIGAPIVVVVLADGSYSLIRIAQSRQGLPRYGVDFDRINNVMAARACGVRASRVSTSAELRRAARNALNSRETTVIEVPIDADDYLPII